MDDRPAGPAQILVRKSKPVNALSEADLTELAACHRSALPRTASSRAGNAALRRLYDALCQDAASLVLWVPGQDGHGCGAFASGTVDRRAVESRVLRRLGVPAVLRLLLRTLLDPRHALATRRWNRIVPSRGAGYILTLGVSPGSRKGPSPVRGRMLVALLEEWFRAAGMTESWVDTEAENAAAQAMYGALGYAVAATAFGQVLMKKRL